MCRIRYQRSKTRPTSWFVPCSTGVSAFNTVNTRQCAYARVRIIVILASALIAVVLLFIVLTAVSSPRLDTPIRVTVWAAPSSSLTRAHVSFADSGDICARLSRIVEQGRARWGGKSVDVAWLLFDHKDGSQTRCTVFADGTMEMHGSIYRINMQQLEGCFRDGLSDSTFRFWSLPSSDGN